MHWLFNVVVGKKDYPAAILIRGAGSLSGPAKVTKYLRIDNKLNGMLATPVAGIWFEDRGLRIRRGEYRRLPRIGVSYAGKVWSNKPYRFLLTKKLPKNRK
jgi:DNA-3-methyladenine glycosylase